MISLPRSGASLLVRVDFTDDDAWAHVVDEATRPSPEGFQAVLFPVSDPAADGADWRALRDAAMSHGRHHSVLFAVDAVTLGSADHPVLVVSTSRYHRDHHPEKFAATTPFRCVTSKLWSVENNLNLANMDWNDYASSVDSGGVFRGF